MEANATKFEGGKKKNISVSTFPTFFEIPKSSFTYGLFNFYIVTHFD
jgi:hypothetical protein